MGRLGSSHTVEVEALEVALRHADPGARRARALTGFQGALRSLGGAPRDPLARAGGSPRIFAGAVRACGARRLLMYVRI